MCVSQGGMYGVVFLLPAGDESVSLEALQFITNSADGYPNGSGPSDSTPVS